MVKFVTFEVYTMNNNGEWRLNSRFSSDEKQAALDFGRNIESKEGIPVKIIKETFDSNTNSSDDTVLYISPKIRHTAKKRRTSKYSKNYHGKIPNLIHEEEEQETSFSRVVWMFIFILMISFVLASISSFIAVFILSSYTNISNAEGSKVILVLFIAIFTLTAIPMSRKFIPWHRIKYSDNNNPMEDYDTRGISVADKFQNMISNFLFNEKNEEEKIVEKKSESVSSKHEQIKQKNEHEKEFKSIFENKDLLKEENPFEGLEQMKKEKETTDGITPVVNPGVAQEENENDTPPEKKIDIVYEDHKKKIAYFIKEVVLTLKSEALGITAFSKFGINLLVVGALDKIREKSNLSDENYKNLLIDALLLLGIQPHLAETFYEKIGNYTLNPSYLQMMQRGKEVMNEMANQSPDFQEKTSSAFKEWLKPVSKEHDIITVMFTDITDSTAITQEIGDEKAYGLIKTHNAIVRKVLQEMHGREIKHTGDGIMASFLSALNGVHAAVLIQRLVASYNKERPDFPLKLKIGMSAGEPIREGEDLFGATVQIASRLCSHATSGQILVSKEITELGASSSHEFTKIGEEELKGLKEPIEIFEAKYSDDIIPKMEEVK